MYSLTFLQLLLRVMNICSTLSPSAEAPEELITATQIAQTCFESVFGSVGTGSVASASSRAGPTPQKLSQSAFDALVRENKSLIERVI